MVRRADSEERDDQEQEENTSSMGPSALGQHQKDKPFLPMVEQSNFSYQMSS